MPTPVTIYFIPHTHWDREWYLTQKQFQFRLQSMVAELLEAMEAPGEKRVEKFTLDGQTVILEDLLAWRPELRPRLIKLIQSGRLEVGPWYTMPDLWLPTPEAIRRNLERGRRDCAEWGVPARRFLYIPDSFGMPAGLPGLLRAEGFEAVLFGRSQPPCFGETAVDFRWTNPDGTNAVTALALPNSYFNAALLPGAHDSKRLMAWLNQLIQAHAHKAVPHLIGAFAGVDHIRIQRDLPAIISSLCQLFPSYRFVQATLSEYTEAVVRALPPTLPEYRGSLRGKLSVAELHGTWSTRQDIKSEDHVCSELLERASALATEAAADSLVAAPLAEAWTLLLQNHAHDSICGCSPDATVADQLTRYRWIKQIATDVIETSLQHISKTRFGDRRGVLFSPPERGSILNLAELTVDSDAGAAPLQSGKFPLSSQFLDTEIIDRTDVCFTYAPLKPTEERQTKTQRHHWLVQLPAQTGLTLSAFGKPHRVRVAAKKQKPPLAFGQITNLIRDLEIVEDVGGLYSHLPNGKSQLWKPSRQVARRTEKGPLRWAQHLTLTYPETRLARHPFAPKPARLIRRLTLQLFPHVPIAVINDTWEGEIEFARVRLPLGLHHPELLVTRDEFDQVRSDRLDDLRQTPAVRPSDRAFFFRNWIDLRAPGSAPLTFFGNGLHEFSLTDSAAPGVAITLLRAQGYVQVSADWPSPGAQFHGSRTLRYAVWLGETNHKQKAAFSAELAVPVIAEPTHEYEPEATKGFGHATIRTRIGGKPVIDSPLNWRPQPTYRSGWWQRSRR